MTHRLKASSAAAVLLACGTLCAQQADRGDRARTEALSRRAVDRLRALQTEADRLASDERTLLGDLRKLEIDREIKGEELRETTQKVEGVSREITELDQLAAQLELEERAARPALAARLVELYKLGQGRYLRLLLSAPDIRHVAEASRMVVALATRDHERIASFQQQLEQLNASRAALQARSHELAALRAEAEAEQVAADRAVAAHNDLIRKIDTERDLNAQLAGELQGVQQKLQGVLRDLAGASSTSTAALPLGPFRGDLEWPVVGPVRHRFTGTALQGGAAANGIEIAAPEGANVAAVHDGSVAFAGSFAGFGNLVIVDHGGQNFSLYGNLKESAVPRGARVGAGDIVGSVGLSPSGEPRLYFELRIDGRPVDPLQWFKKR